MRFAKQNGPCASWGIRLALACFVLVTVLLALSVHDSQLNLRGRWREWSRALPGEEAERHCELPCPKQLADGWNYKHHTPALNSVSDIQLAQTLFNQGLLWRFGFSATSSRAAFEAALEVDKGCAMCYWGVAYSYALNINMVALPDYYPYPYNQEYTHFSTDDNRAGRAALIAAMEIRCSPTAKGYIEAMWLRFQRVDQVEMEQQFWYEFLYGAKMVMIWKADLTDHIAGVLAAEGFMNTMPWRFLSVDGTTYDPITPDITWRDIIESDFLTQSADDFQKQTGIPPDDKILHELELKPKAEKRKVNDPHFKTLSQVVQHMLLLIEETEPDMPMANHLHIHLTEMSSGSNPGVATQDANWLMETAPQWRAGHLAHMPSHNYYRVGNFYGGVMANIEAHCLDFKTNRQCMAPYSMEHNLRVLMASACMGALFTPAIEWAQNVRTLREYFQEPSGLSAGYDYTSKIKIWALFGYWNEVLAEDPPKEEDGARGSRSAYQGFFYANGVYHYLRYMALAQPGYGERGNAQKEYDAALEEFHKINYLERMYPGYGPGNYNSGYFQGAQVHVKYMNARNATVHGDLYLAIQLMGEAVEIIDKLYYTEPPWVRQPPRQCLGYLYLVSGKKEMAQRVYLRDLQDNWNPWSSFGCEQAGCPMDKYTVLNREKLFKEGDYVMTSSCPMLELSSPYQSADLVTSV